MDTIFIRLYTFFQQRRSVFWFTLLMTLGGLGIGASRIELEEDISRFLPDDERMEKVNYVFQHSKFVERLVVMVSISDSSVAAQPDSLVAFADAWIAKAETELKPYLNRIDGEVDDARVMEMLDVVESHLPVFLTERDYISLDSLTQPVAIRQAMERNYHQLISPSGVAVKKVILKDPLGISFLALKKLQQLQYDDNFELYDGYIVTKDHRHLIFFLYPAFPPNETKQNAKFLNALDESIASVKANHTDVTASYFGALAVAVGNAKQLQRDTILTVSLMLILLSVFLIGFFRRKRVFVLILLPVAFGGLFALCCVYLLQGSVSILALAVGAVILGIAVDYAIHYLVTFRQGNDARHVIKDLTKPLTIGSLTTVLAFFSLQFTNAAVLRDIGLFAGFSLIGAAFCTLVFLPQVVGKNTFTASATPNWLERVALTGFESRKYLVYTILLLTPVLLYFASGVTFNSDMSKLNFMKEDLRESQQRLETINRSTLNSIYLTATSATLDKALQKNEQAMVSVDELKQAGRIDKVASVSSFLVSDSLQHLRLTKWYSFWTEERKQKVIKVIREEGARLKFSEMVFANAENLLSKAYAATSDSTSGFIRKLIFDDFVIDKNGVVTVIALVNVLPADKAEVYEHLAATSTQAFDRQMLTNTFVEYVHADFNFIVTFTSVLVFVMLLILFGRIEITLITFVPMLFTWIWILGIMALVGIEFNIVNVMVSTFIFGLGDDYSIFVMDGLQQEYSRGKKMLSSIRVSIMLSALTTICGLGVLIFAQHPALRSIAAISIIGIVCVFVMAVTIEPFFFRWMISNRAARGLSPMSLFGIFKTVFTYGFFVFGSFFMTLVGLVLWLIPFRRKRVKYFYHVLISGFTRTLIYLSFNLKKKILGRAPEIFNQPSIIISNHASFLDILLTTMQHPKLILLTNKWVWNSPVFGGVVRLADYYPVMEGAEESVDRLRDRVKEGYSVVVFPEGTRSVDGMIRRFHKGAFYLAQELNVPIQPLLIHGANDGIQKGDMYLNDSFITLKFLPKIESDDKRFGDAYTERTKKISRYFKDEFNTLATEERRPAYFAYRLIRNYLYKGPVLEWYLKIKLKLEKNYEPFHWLVPASASVLDLGCGYGFLCYMLQFLSQERTITGVDYDEEKIDVAQHGYLRSDRLQFCYADVTTFPLQQYDVIIISDVLHYLEVDQQERLLAKCFNALNPGGKVIVRDGNADLKERHKGTRLTEFFSVRLLGFNKATNTLNFVSGGRLKSLAQAHGLEVSVLDDTTYTSNVIFVMEKK